MQGFVIAVNSQQHDQHDHDSRSNCLVAAKETALKGSSHLLSLAVLVAAVVDAVVVVVVVVVEVVKAGIVVAAIAGEVAAATQRWL